MGLGRGGRFAVFFAVRGGGGVAGGGGGSLVHDQLTGRSRGCVSH